MKSRLIVLAVCLLVVMSHVAFRSNRPENSSKY